MGSLRRIFATLIAAQLLSGHAAAGSLKVYPVRIELTPKDPVQTMTIQNEGTDVSRVQLRVYAWRQENGEDVFEETRDVLANPALFELAPSGEQIARFGLRTTAGRVEKSYRVFLEEIPAAAPRQPGQVQTLLRISIPIFVPGSQTAARLQWRAWPAGARRLMLAIRNAGTTHVQISRIALAERGGSKLGGRDLSVYLLPGSAQQLPLDLLRPVRAGQAIKLDVMTDQGRISADLVSEAGPREEASR
jgi:fimbrial chaperone protein